MKPRPKRNTSVLAKTASAPAAATRLRLLAGISADPLQPSAPHRSHQP